MQEHESICCDICQEDYNLTTKVPRFLTCGHTFCTSCLTMSLQCSNFKCPIDRSAITVAAAELLPKNFSLIRIIERDSNKLYCQIHKKLLDLVCLNDSKQLCSHCLLYDHHTGHEVIVLDEYMKLLKNYHEQLSWIVSNLKETALEQIEKKHNSKQYEIEEKVKSFFKEIRMKTDQIESNILSRISGEFEQVKLSTVSEEVIKHWVNKAECTLESIWNAGEGGAYMLNTEEKQLIESGNAILNDSVYLKSASELNQINFTTNEAALDSLISLNITGQHSTSPLRQQRVDGLFNEDVPCLSIDTLCSFCNSRTIQGSLCSIKCSLCNFCLLETAKEKRCVKCKHAMKEKYWNKIKNSKTFNCKLCDNRECLANAFYFDCDCLFCVNCTKSIQEQFRSNRDLLKCICGTHLTDIRMVAVEQTLMPQNT